MNRRRFVGALAVAPFLAWAAALFAGKATARGISGQNQGAYPQQGPGPYPPQTPGPFPNIEPPSASEGPLSGPGQDFPPVTIDRHAILVQNQKNIRKDVARLYDLAGKLKKQVTQTDLSEVLSLNMIQTADEIGKLAKQITNLAKG